MIKPESFSTPVLFLVFSRPDTTRRVFEAIRQVKPSRLYIAADGPRDNKLGEDLKVQEVRKYVMSNIDWECEIKTLFREKNLGCKLAVSSAIDWFFENEEEGIILEDDCLPDVSFFPFCSELLERYRHDERVMMVSGVNFLGGQRVTPYSYFFSKYNYIWGWASWRRAWKHYDVNMRLWPEFREKAFLLGILDKKEYIHWSKYFDDIFSGKVDTWDAQWTFSLWTQNGLSVMPAVNLVCNIGFGAQAFHTTKQIIPDQLLKSGRMPFPLEHPSYILCDKKADALMRKVFQGTLLDQIKHIVPLKARLFIKKTFFR